MYALSPFYPISIVVKGGTLDIRFVTLYKGAGRMLLEGRMKLTVGGVAKVDFGGNFKGLG